MPQPARVDDVCVIFVCKSAYFGLCLRIEEAVVLELVRDDCLVCRGVRLQECLARADKVAVRVLGGQSAIVILGASHRTLYVHGDTNRQHNNVGECDNVGAGRGCVVSRDGLGLRVLLRGGLLDWAR